MKPKNFSGGHLTRTQKAADPSEESMRNHPAWTVKCKFKDFRATWRYVFNILYIYGLYSSCQYQIGSYQYSADGFKNLGSKTLISSIQSFFEISDCIDALASSVCSCDQKKLCVEAYHMQNQIQSFFSAWKKSRIVTWKCRLSV